MAAPSKNPQGRELVIDCDVHVTDTPQAIAPYCEMPWRKSLEILGKVPQRYLDIPGWSPSTRALAPTPGTPPGRTIPNVKAMRDELDAIGVDHGILLPDHLLFFAMYPSASYATALMQAYNRWLVSEWVEPGNKLWAAIIACPQNPTESAREIERYATDPRVKAVFLPTAGVSPLWGHAMYEPILAAAEAADLPVILHSVTVVCSAFPAQLDQFENQFGRSVVGHAFAMMANLTSLMHTGVPARHPKLRIVFTEAGISWVPYLMWRMDKYHQEMRRTVPFLELRPSEYMKRQMWFATQPIEEPDRPAHLVEAIEHFDGSTRTVFASDWPHHDFDHPRALQKLPLTPEQRRNIMWKNAAELFRIPVDAAPRATEPALQA